MVKYMYCKVEGEVCLGWTRREENIAGAKVRDPQGPGEAIFIYCPETLRRVTF